ncbi:MAG: hypothetical protein HGA31_05950 [Candidatus Moranbacteria bacterium]|nr:hypothetical protein [Candidatus Moranbacteria bacterium]
MSNGTDQLVVQDEQQVAVQKNTVIVQKWEESERGWGTRPDGFSFHLTETDRAAFVKDYWDSMPNETQEEYSRPDGEPYQIEVDDETFALLETSENGIRSYDSPPGSGGTDGWVPRR